MITYNHPVEPLNYGNYLGMYVQDAWTIGRRLSLHLGVRWSTKKRTRRPSASRRPNSRPGACFPTPGPGPVDHGDAAPAFRVRPLRQR